MAKPEQDDEPPLKTRKEVLDALGSYQRKGALDLDTETALLDAFKNETDRGFIVVLGSHAEDYLLAAVLDKLPPISRSLQKDLTRSGGALGTWAQIINVALAMGVIDDDDANDLEVFKTMRNACAHSRQQIDFNTAELRDAIGLLTVPAVSGLPRGDNWRDLFRRMVAHVFRYMLGRFIWEEPKKTPRERYGEWVDSMPRAQPQSSPQKRRQRQLRSANPDQPKPKPPRPPRSSRE